MTNSKSRILAAVAGAIAMGASAAWADAPQDARIQELEAKVAALQASQASSSTAVAATIESVLRDAEKRSQLLAVNGMGAGYDNGFYIQGGDFSLRPSVQFQFRQVTTWRGDTEEFDFDEDDDDGDEIESGFEVRRLKFGLEGFAFTRALTYSFVWATEREGGGMFLEDAFVTYMYSDDFGVRLGQHKTPVHHEELVSSKRQLAADRSVVNEVLGGGVLDRTHGISVVYGNYNANNPVSATLMFHDGFNEDNTDFTKHDFDFGIAGRVEYKAQGNTWVAYNDFSAMGNDEALLVFGAGFDWSQMGDLDVLHATIDAQWEGTNGLGVFAALLVQHADGSADFTNLGFLLQAGYMLNQSWELFGRYGLIDFDGEIVTVAGDADDVFHEFTVGLNYFLGGNGSWGHRAKFTIDLTFIPDAASPVHSNTGIGLLGDGNDEVSIRTQFQLLI